MSTLERVRWQRFIFRWLAVSGVLHLLATVLSQGFYHSDEHFQILEFLNWKLGNSPASALPIEFAEKMRPWLESWIFYGLVRFWRLWGIFDPFAWALSFRALSSALGWISIVLLALCCRHWFGRPDERRLQRAAVIALALTWYLPAFHARLSSENWGGSVFIIGLCTFLLTRVYVPPRGSSHAGRLPQKVQDFFWASFSGFLLGASFEFRYQIGVMIAGALLWFFLRARIPWRDTLGLALGLFLALALGTLVDAWGYGQWVIAPWNYLDFNLLRGMVGIVDRDPWWDLFRRALTETWPVLGFLVLCALPLAWITRPLHILTWTHLPLFLTHALIGHKELRFIFPLAHAAPVLLVLGLGSAVQLLKKALPIVIWTLLIWNTLALLVTTLMPAWMPIRFLEFEWRFRATRREPVMILHWKEKNPYDVSGIPMNFYRPPGVQMQQISAYSQVFNDLTPDQPYWLFYDGFTLTGEAEALKRYCQLEFQSLPPWIESTAAKLNVSPWLRHVTNWSLYRCSR